MIYGDMQCTRMPVNVATMYTMKTYGLTRPADHRIRERIVQTKPVAIKALPKSYFFKRNNIIKETATINMVTSKPPVASFAQTVISAAEVVFPKAVKL